MTYPTLSLSQINRDERYRKSYKNIDKLAASINELGLAQPVVLNSDLKLVAGGRRCAALELLGITQLEHGLTCTPGRAGYVISDELSPERLLELELEENIQRQDTEWFEDVLQFKNIEQAYRRKAALESKSWGVRQAGMLLGVSSGRAANILVIADHLLRSDKEIQEAGSVDNAIRILLGRKEDECNKLLAAESSSQFDFSSTQRLPGEKDALEEIVIDLGDLPGSRSQPRSAPDENVIEFCSETEQNEEEPELLAPGFSQDEVTIPLSQMFYLGDFRDVMPKVFSDESIDHIITDIPYGIDMDNLDLQGQERVDEAHDVEENVQLMPAFMQQSFRVLKDKGFLIFFYDLDHHTYLRDLGEQAGFQVTRWPFVWVKTHPCKNNAPLKNPTKSIETAYFMRKGNATLNKPMPKGYVSADGSIERKMYRNPFAKPFEVWQTLIEAVALKGQLILDPFAGEMSCPRAVINCGMKPRGIEKYEHHYNAGIEGIKLIYNVLTRNKVKYV